MDEEKPKGHAGQTPQDGETPNGALDVEFDNTDSPQ